MKILAICGSPRKGNTEFVLKTLLNDIKSEKELVLLRNKKISPCSGCMLGARKKRCVIEDDMKELNQKLESCDVLIIGTPNYFDNVSGILKNFIDRTNPFHETDALRGKKVITIVVGGGKIKNSKRIVNQAIKHFIRAHDMESFDYACFRAIKPDELEKNKDVIKKLGVLANKINSINRNK